MTDGPISRVLVVAPTPFFGDRGCHVRIYEEVRALAQLNIKTVVATYATGRNLADVTIVRAAQLPGITPKQLGPSWSRPLLDGALLATTLAEARRLRPDVLHAHLHEGIVIGAAVRTLLGIPLVADLQGSLTAELIDHRFVAPSGAPAAGLRRLERWLVRQPDALVVSSATGATQVATQGAEPARVTSLPDGVDLEAFHPMTPDRELRRQLGIGDKRVVVFLGVLTPYQGVDVLLDAVPEVVRQVPDAHFLVMGYPNEDHYRALVRARGLETVVSLPGRIPYAEAAKWLNLGVLAVSAKASLTEANGKLLNYMACGLPVVATDTPVNHELLGGDGVYVPVDDAPALAVRVAELLGNPREREARGAALRRRAVEQFAWPALVRRLIDVYTQAQARRRPAR